MAKLGDFKRLFDTPTQLTPDQRQQALKAGINKAYNFIYEYLDTRDVATTRRLYLYLIHDYQRGGGYAGEYSDYEVSLPLPVTTETPLLYTDFNQFVLNVGEQWFLMDPGNGDVIWQGNLNSIVRNLIKGPDDSLEYALFQTIVKVGGNND